MKMFFTAVILSICFTQNVFAQEISVESEKDLKAYLETFREARSLLGSGDSRLTASFDYQINTSKTSLVNENNKSVGFMSGFEYGVTNKVGAYGIFSYSNRNFFSESFLGDTLEDSVNSKSFKVGGKSVLVLEDKDVPEIVVDLSISTLSFGDTNEQVVNLKFNAIKSFDPIIVVGSIGMTRLLDSQETFLNFSPGIAFGINDRVALGTNISWDVPLDGNVLSSKDVVVLTERLTMTFGNNVIEPAVSLGLTDFSPDMSFSLSWSRRF
ncbi:hypothetical protein KKC45_04090 [Patescibacteria group bacterium]|nr:hypothetical protein [Patescibacteria group bacterium]